jgi:hypothetical protein
MKTSSEENSAALFSIEKISSVPSSISMLGGCALCEHCTLLRLMAHSRLGPCQSTDKQQTKAQRENKQEYKQ